MKVILAYWPSLWQAATENEKVVDLIFGVFSSKEKALQAVSNSLTKEEWEEYNGEFVYEELNVDQYHPIPDVR